MHTEMKTVWLVGCQDENPVVYLADAGGLTYQRVKAKHFDTPEKAKAEIVKLQLASQWQIVPHVASQTSDA